MVERVEPRALQLIRVRDESVVARVPAPGRGRIPWKRGLVDVAENDRAAAVRLHPVVRQIDVAAVGETTPGVLDDEVATARPGRCADRKLRVVDESRDEYGVASLVALAPRHRVADRLTLRVGRHRAVRAVIHDVAVRVLRVERRRHREPEHDRLLEDPDGPEDNAEGIARVRGVPELAVDGWRETRVGADGRPDRSTERRAEELRAD